MKNILTAVLILTAVRAGAVQNIKYGSLEINPLVSVQQSYDSNIYLTKAAPKSAWINRTGLGVGLVNKVGSRLDLIGGYTIEFLSYSRATNINNATHHLANLGATARLSKRVTGALVDSYMQTTDQATSELTARALRVQNMAGVNVEAPLRGDLGFNLAVQHVYNNYLNSAFDMLDRQEMLAEGDVTYKVQPKTKLVLGYRYGTMDYRIPSAKNGDATYNNLDLGVSGSLAPKLVGTVKGGVQFRNYEKRLNQAANSITTFGYNAQLAWKPVESTDVIFYGARGNIESTYGDSRFYTSSMGDVTLSRQVRKIKAGLGVTYEDVRFPESTAATGKKRHDGNTSIHADAEYGIQKWLKAGAAYAYKSRASNERAFKYRDNVFSVSLKGLF